MNHLSQLVIFGFEGASFTPELFAFLKEAKPGGIVLFKRNIETPLQVRQLVGDLQSASPVPLIVGADQEGGRVARFGVPFTRIPAMGKLGRAAAENPSLAFEVGRVLGRELSAVGVTLDFAPVLDVATNPANPVIGDRAFSSDPEVVARLGTELIRGLQGEGVAACGKHFPGHGDTDVDSHVGLPKVPHARERLDACELVPFRAAISAGVAAMMTAHICLPALDREEPATVSRSITTGILREELGFGGLILTDCLTMEGIAFRYPPAESAWRAIAAGADIAIVCHSREKQLAALEGLRRAADEGRLGEERIAEALGRIARFKERYPPPGRARPPLSAIGKGSFEIS